MAFRLTVNAVVIAIVGTAVPIALAAVVARFARRRDLVSPFVALNAAIAGWGLDYVLLGVVTDAKTAALVDRAAQAFILAIPWCWIVYTAIFVERPLSPLARRLAASWLLLLFAAAWTPWYFTGYRLHPFGFYGIAGPLYPLVVLTFVASYVAAAKLLVSGVRRATDPRVRNQRLHVLSASLLMGLIGFDNFLPVFGVNHRPFGNLAILAYSGILAMALVRHRLMDFTVVFRRGLLYSTLTALASLVYIVLTLVGSELLRGVGAPPRALPVFAGLGVAAGAYPALRWTQRRFLHGTGGRVADRRRLLREARDRWQRAGDGGTLESLFRETMASRFPGIELSVLWGEEWRNPPFPDGDVGSWSVPLRSGSRVAGWVVLRAGGGWSLEELDLAADLSGCFASLWSDLSHRHHVRGIEEFHRRILDSIDIGLLLVDGRGAVVAANDAGNGLLSRIGQGPRTIDVGLLATTEPVAAAGGREVRIRETAIPSERLPGLRVVALEDVSEQRELERRAKRAQTVSALGRMGAMVAHEIRTPLSTIMGACTLLKSCQTKDGESAEYIGIILEEVRRVERFVDNCLRATRDPRPTLDARSFDPLVREIVAGCPAAGDAPVVLTLGARGATVRVDEELMRAVVGNLVDNARRSYGEGEGAVEVRTGVLHEEGRESVTLAVADKGRGMEPGEVRQIFEPFWTKRPGGVGLGLMVVASAVSAMRGEIRVESVPGRGSVFTVSLPLEPGQTA